MEPPEVKVNPVPAIAAREFQSVHGEIYEVTGLGVGHATDLPMIFLSVETPAYVDTKRRFQFALSPAAAARLANLLDQAVAEHLYGDSD